MTPTPIPPSSCSWEATSPGIGSKSSPFGTALLPPILATTFDLYVLLWSAKFFLIIIIVVVVVVIFILMILISFLSLRRLISWVICYSVNASNVSNISFHFWFPVWLPRKLRENRIYNFFYFYNIFVISKNLVEKGIQESVGIFTLMVFR